MRSGPSIGPIRWRRRLLWTIWVNAARKRCLPPPSRSPAGHSRREFLKRAAGVAVGLPVAGALAGNAAAAPRISLTSRAKPFDGITLQFAKAPFGNDEKDVIAKLIKPWEDKTGAKVVHTIVPWNVEGATYATNYAGPNPFDVSYQTSTDLTGLGTKGVLEPLNTKQWLDNPNYASTKAKFIPNTITKSMYKGKLYGLPCIIGGTVIYYNKDLLGKAGVANIPRTEPELMAAAAKIAKLGNGTWGHNVPLSNKDFTWYFLYHGLHNRGVDIISKDQSKVTFNIPQAAAALQFYVDMVTSTRSSRRSASTTARPACRCSRPAGSASCTTSRCGSPSSAARSSRSSGTSSTRSASAASGRSSRRPATGSWPRRARTRTPPGTS